MQISFDFSVFQRTKWHEYALRFLFGGLVTVIAGLLAKHFGPIFGGLFLAFPAIFPASATLIEKHEREKKQRAGILKTKRGRRAAALDAFGAAQGCVALACFAIVLWKVFPYTSVPIALGIAMAVWLGVAMTVWRFCKSHL